MPLAETMELKVREKKEWPLVPEGVYQMEITNLSAEESEWNGEKKEVFKFEFTIIEEGPHYGRRFWKSGKRVSPYPPSGNSKAPLTWKVASAVLKHQLTKEEGKSFTVADMNALIGKQLQGVVVVTPEKENGKKYNNVDSFLAAKQDLAPFDESKVKKEEPASAASPAEIVAKASGGKFQPHGNSEDEDGAAAFDKAMEETRY
jgi:hypothetical protein